nr:MAG TPA: hypothetical protein [Caudoviricetes sp.]
MESINCKFSRFKTLRYRNICTKICFQKWERKTDMCFSAP